MREPATEMESRLFAELKRRNLFRGAFYGASAWRFMQVATRVFLLLYVAGLLDCVIAHSLFDSIRGDPCYADLLRRMDLKR